LEVVRVDDTEERPGEEVLLRVPEGVLECSIDALEVSVEPRDAEQIRRQIEESYQLALERQARPRHPA